MFYASPGGCLGFLPSTVSVFEAPPSFIKQRMSGAKTLQSGLNLENHVFFLEKGTAKEETKLELINTYTNWACLKMKNS